jgi:hypothetical protein
VVSDFHHSNPNSQYFAGKLYVGAVSIDSLARVIDRVVRDTALECSEICRRHADRAPGGLVPVGAAARASDEIRHAFGLEQAARSTEQPASASSQEKR